MQKSASNQPLADIDGNPKPLGLFIYMMQQSRSVPVEFLPQDVYPIRIRKVHLLCPARLNPAPLGGAFPMVSAKAETQVTLTCWEWYLRKITTANNPSLSRSKQKVCKSRKKRSHKPTIQDPSQSPMRCDGFERWLTCPAQLYDFVEFNMDGISFQLERGGLPSCSSNSSSCWW